MNNRMNRNLRNWLILGTLIVVAILAGLWATLTFWLAPYSFARRLPPPRFIAQDLEFYYTAETVVSTVNVTLSVFLLLIYISIYRKTRSEFTIGLTLFSLVFLLNALVSNPLVIWVFGFRPLGLGPFALLPDVFAFGALAVLLYLSFKY